MRVQTATHIIIAFRAALGAKGSRDGSRGGDVEESRSLRKNHVARPLSYHAIVAEKIEGKGHTHWKGDDYGHEHFGKGKSKSKSSKKKSKKTKGSKKSKKSFDGCDDAIGDFEFDYNYGKGHESYKDDYGYDAQNWSESSELNTPNPTAVPSCSRAPSSNLPTKELSVKPSLSHLPTHTPTLDTGKPSSSPFRNSVNPSSNPSSASNSVNPSSQPTESPSDFPTIIFDIDFCESYNRRWLFDLSESCDETYVACQCFDAAKKIEDGLINCEFDRCPDDCVTCDYCLTEVLDCYDKKPPSPSPTIRPTRHPSRHPSDSPSMVLTKEPSVSPSTLPSKLPTSWPSKVPTVPPTDLPTTNPSSVTANPAFQTTGTPSVPPTIEPTGNPTQFDIQNCDSYRDLWTYDLMVEAQCSNAKALVERGLITCSSLPCPDDCSICHVCMNSCLSCEPSSNSPTLTPSARPSFPPGFDLNDCDSYSDRWLRDVIETGRCNEAIELESYGEISCREEDCPQNCAVCNVCMSQIPCVNSDPPIPPKTVAPATSPQPMQAPSLMPTKTPFDLSVCSSYSQDWLLDLTSTCGTLSGLNDPIAQTTCVCSDTEKKISEGLIICGSDVCPEDCSLCQFCMYELLDCLPLGSNVYQLGS